MTPSETWLEAHPGTTANDYVQAMQGSSSAAKKERFLDAVAPGQPRGYFKWTMTDDNWFVLAMWATLASIPLFGVAMVAWSIWCRGW
jgi:hypothetical protein